MSSIAKSKLNQNIKWLTHKALIRPIWSYGIQFRGLAIPSNIRPTRTHQNIALRLITVAPWYISNTSIYKDFKITAVIESKATYYKRSHSKIDYHTNPFLRNMPTHILPENPERDQKGTGLVTYYNKNNISHQSFKY